MPSGVIRCFRSASARTPSVLVAFVDQVFNTKPFSECEAVLVGEFQHILNRPAPRVLFRVRCLAFSQRFERTGDHFLGRMVPTGTELLLDQALTAGIENNVHRTPVYSPELRG